jgi:hypothetical protein
MLLPISTKHEAIKLRKQGYSLKEIADKIHISKSTASIWLDDVLLSEKAKTRLKKRKIFGQYKSIQISKEKRIMRNKQYNIMAIKTLKHFAFNTNTAKILCSLIYYCEGIKGSDSRVTFINSDPTLIKLFLSLLRKGFIVNESKFRMLMHLHDYHNQNKQMEFWSKLSSIPKNQFSKTYIKPHTKIRIRKNYQGCVSIRYYHANIAKELLSLYKIAAEKFSIV